MITNICLHLTETTKAEAWVRESYTVINLGEAGEQSLFFKSEQHLRSFLENILQQLDKGEESA